jgi:uncharacterized repeat protein (TIGR03803 family)
MQSKKYHPAETAFFAIGLALLLALAITAQTAQAQNYKVLHTFHGKDGDGPTGQLVLDKSGNLYETTFDGGTGKCQIGCGTALKMNSAGKIIWTHSFDVSNGWGPLGGVVRYAEGSLFGTTVYGGKAAHGCPDGCGLVFELDNTGKKETVLHKFTSEQGGYFPDGPVVEDSEGNLYGVAYIGGEYGYGAVFKVDSAGGETSLYDFTGGSDGCFPFAGVILDASDNVYGVTNAGGAGFCGSGYGVVFEVDTAGNETVLHTFEGEDGANPNAQLLLDPKGNLYSTTENGGSGPCQGGCGTVFELSPGQNGTWSEKVLYSFCSVDGCADGFSPARGPLAMGANGDLYGTTESGGGSQTCNGGCGVVFMLDSAGKETVLHSFSGGADGATPFGGLTIDSASNLYGAATIGGDLKCADDLSGDGCGVVFKMTP